jgi:uncharacterized protein YggU (UPF0235/DUF167 family)
VAGLAVRVTPRAALELVGPYRAAVLQVRVTRPPADGEANRAVQRLLAAALQVAPSRVRLLTGARSRAKRYEIDLARDELERRLAALPDPAD